jgi:signal transduction histidine kinase
LIKRLSIPKLLLVAFLLAGLLPAMLVSFLSFYQARVVLKKELTRDIVTLSQTVSNDVSRMMFERVKNVASWSQLAIMQELLLEDVDKRLSIFLEELNSSYDGVYKTIYVVDINNKVIASSNAKLLNQTANLPNYWFSHGEAEKRIDFYKIKSNALSISQEIKDDNSNIVIGKLVAEFNWQQIQDFLKTAVRKPTAAALLDEQGNLLASTTNWNTQNGYEMRAVSQFSSQSVVSKWQLRVEKLHSVAIAPVHRLGYIFLALLATTLLLAAFLVTPIAQAITQPLAKLTIFVRSFKQGQLSETPKSGPPEVQELALAFEGLIGDLVKTQANLSRAAKLAVVGELAAAMSHEIRTPLGILRSSADLLLREPKLTNDGKEVLGFIISETERLNKLVSSLIDAARPRAPVFVKVDIAQVIKNSIALLRGQAESNGIVLNSEFAGPVFLEVDTDQMTQVFMNILMNAIQILPTGGVVNIRLHTVEDTAKVEISDDGPGMTEEIQAQIFEPFFTQRAGGVGLGLAIVRQIILSHHGEITCSNSQFGGALFTISLPLSQLVKSQ